MTSGSDKKVHDFVCCDRNVLPNAAAKSGKIDNFRSLVGKSLHISPAKLEFQIQPCSQQSSSLPLLVVNFLYG